MKQLQNLKRVPEEIFTTSAAFVSSIIQVSNPTTRMLSLKLRTPNSADNWSAKIRKKALRFEKSEAHGFGICSFICIRRRLIKEEGEWHTTVLVLVDINWNCHSHS